MFKNNEIRPVQCTLIDSILGEIGTWKRMGGSISDTDINYSSLPQ